jgi:hypothetical protein
MWSIENAGIMVDSPRGGCISIRKLDVDLISDDQWAVVVKCADHTDTHIDLTKEEMALLLSAAQSSKGIYRIGKEAVGTCNVVPKQNLAAPKIKVPHQTSYMQRNRERLNRIAAMNQSTLSGQCPNCNQYGLKVANHGTWAGFFCSKCNKGGSLTIKK